ncbi:MAG: hypothetical protein SGARI_001041, partial [Bacillariaceae sp.]
MQWQLECQVGYPNWRAWNVETVDNDAETNATINKSIHDLSLEDLGFVPDFAWASPDYKAVGGSDEECVKLLRCVFVMFNFFREHNPYIILVIESPGDLSNLKLFSDL